MAHSQRTPPGLPIVLVRWYDYARWMLERVETFPKSQRFVLGQRISHLVMEALEELVEASLTAEKGDRLRLANRRIEVVRWTVRMAKDRNLLTASQFEHSAEELTVCGRMVGGWIKEVARRRGNEAAEEPVGPGGVAGKSDGGGA